MHINTLELEDEDLRIIANSEQVYEAWLSASREENLLPDWMTWKPVNGTQYLYEARQGLGEPKSLGPRSPVTEKVKAEFDTKKAEIQDRVDSTAARLKKLLSQYQSLHLPQVMSLPGKILRALDINNYLGNDLIVVGTTAFAAYEIEARERFAHGLDETEDFDLGWCRGSNLSVKETSRAVGSPLFSTIRQVDSSFQLNKKKPYQAINKHGFEVELLTAPSVMKTLSSTEVFSTMAIHEQEWLLLGSPIRHLVCARDGAPAPLVVPDPRWMGLHKLWLANKETRRADKKGKDAKQGDLLLDAVARKMTTNYPMDVDFVLSLPQDLLPVFNGWAQQRGFVPGNRPPRPDW